MVVTERWLIARDRQSTRDSRFGSGFLANRAGLRRSRAGMVPSQMRRETRLAC